ncbi:MAG TPA: cytochrome b/b6 domain-containing protein [Pseudonocardia sp.]|jgi:cytochrome b561|nr:cytochrome b/b6 domain-containing protein [Pseudonocardia sp.]
MAPEPGSGPARFTPTARLLHWSSAAMVLAMLFIGVTMVTTTASYHLLLAVHRPLGVAILLTTVARLGYRLRQRPPALPTTMHPLDRLAARATEYALYALLLVQPVLGWASVSATGMPVVLLGGLHLPAITPVSPGLYATLHQAHTVAAYLLFLVFLAHLSGALLHGLVLRDGVVNRMAWSRAEHGSSSPDLPGPTAPREPTEVPHH